MKRLFLGLFFVSMIMGISPVGHAAVYDITVGEYSSPLHEPGAYYDTYYVGQFVWDMTGQEAIAATISGTWGNTANPTSANNELWVLNYTSQLKIGDTTLASPDPRYNYFVPWTYTFSDLDFLSDGVLFFYTIQTSEYYVRLGETTLHVETQAVPEASAIMLLGSGLVGLVGYRRMRRMM